MSVLTLLPAPSPPQARLAARVLLPVLFMQRERLAAGDHVVVKAISLAGDDDEKAYFVPIYASCAISPLIPIAFRPNLPYMI